MPIAKHQRGPNRGLTTGLGKSQFLLQLFIAQSKARLCDAKLDEKMRREFPACTSDWYARIPYLRNLYNRGGLRFQEGVPKNSIPKYDAFGQLAPRLRGPAPKCAR